jgi:hypothetical protein
MWTYIKANGGMGLEEQWSFRPYVLPLNVMKPLCQLKRNGGGHWLANLLNESGVSATAWHLGNVLTLEQAKLECEAELRMMGWNWKVKR